MKAALRERRQALKRQLAELRARARAKVASNPAVQKARRRRRVRRGALAASLLLLLLLSRCQCDVEPVAPVPEPAPGPAKVEPAKPQVKEPQPLRSRVKTQPRGQYQPQSRARPKWLEAFHLQVSARAGRLARCFDGADRPGALRWAAALNAKSGAVSDHEIEPLGAGASFTGENSACVISVLSDPPYRLEIPASEPLPDRVGLVIEF